MPSSGIIVLLPFRIKTVLLSTEPQIPSVKRLLSPSLFSVPQPEREQKKGLFFISTISIEAFDDDKNNTYSREKKVSFSNDQNYEEIKVMLKMRKCGP